MVKKYPTLLYKYRVWKNDYHKRILTGNEIFFASSKHFNDPFDCSIPIRYDALSRHDKIEIVENRLKRNFPNLDPKNLWQLTKLAVNEGFNPESQEDIYDFQRKSIEENFGIFSLTEDHKNIVMWSHYADFHRGFCDGFNVNLLWKFFLEEKINKIPTPIFLENIEYSSEYPSLIPIKSFIPEVFIKAVTTKSSYWKYEKEYRLIILGGTTRFSVTLPKEIISEVILVCKMCKDMQQEIQAILKERNLKVALYKAKMKKLNFGLDFEEIQY